VAEAADFRQFALVATCWGDAIAIEYAVRRTERVVGDLTRVGWRQEDHDFGKRIGDPSGA
jgi:hypothetical protein